MKLIIMCLLISILIVFIFNDTLNIEGFTNEDDDEMYFSDEEAEYNTEDEDDDEEEYHENKSLFHPLFKFAHHITSYMVKEGFLREGRKDRKGKKEDKKQKKEDKKQKKEDKKQKKEQKKQKKESSSTHHSSSKSHHTHKDRKHHSKEKTHHGRKQRRDKQKNFSNFANPTVPGDDPYPLCMSSCTDISNEYNTYKNEAELDTVDITQLNEINLKNSDDGAAQMNSLIEQLFGIRTNKLALLSDESTTELIQQASDGKTNPNPTLAKNLEYYNLSEQAIMDKLVLLKQNNKY